LNYFQLPTPTQLEKAKTWLRFSTFHMNMGRLIILLAEKEKAMGSNDLNGGHA
jgi:hypothetical protein